MTKQEFHAQLIQIFGEMPVTLSYIKGTALPSGAPMCRNHMILAGRACYLTNAPVLEETKKYVQAREVLRDIIHYQMEARSEALYKEFGDNPDAHARTKEIIIKEFQQPLMEAYENLLRAEMELGVVRIPCLEQFYLEDAVVKSRYGDWNVNYSPELTTITGGKSVEDIANILCNAVLKPEQRNLMTLVFYGNVSEEHLPEIYKLMHKATALWNAYLKEEFELQKDNKQYQYRDDWDPESL